MPIETYEQAVARTGHKWPYRNKEWPCPACGKAECDLNVYLEVFKRQGQPHLYVYRHIPDPPEVA